MLILVEFKLILERHISISNLEANNLYWRNSWDWHMKREIDVPFWNWDLNITSHSIANLLFNYKGRIPLNTLHIWLMDRYYFQVKRLLFTSVVELWQSSLFLIKTPRWTYYCLINEVAELQSKQNAPQ